MPARSLAGSQSKRCGPSQDWDKILLRVRTEPAAGMDAWARSFGALARTITSADRG
jgi:hypothetical protein